MAGGGSSKGDGKKKARIEIIPLIDVIFFLLATFVLFTLSLDRIQSVPIDLPKVEPPKSSTPPPEDESSVTLQVSDGGTLYWNKELISVGEVVGRLSQLRSSFPDPKVLIATDDRAKYGDTINVLDQVRLAGIEKVSIETIYRPTGK